MKITLQQLVGSADALGRLNNNPLRAAVSFRLAGLVEIAQSNLTAYNEKQLALLEKYGTLNQEESNKLGKPYFNFNNPDDSLKYANELAELGAVEVDLPQVSLSLFDIGDSIISSGDILQLSWLINLPTLEVQETNTDVAH